MSSIHTTLETVFGLPTFRPYQEPIITDVLAGRSVLGILPTGAGKSLCYQLPAVTLPPMTLVISPLIALMVDQVAHLTALGIPAAAWTSQLSANDQMLLHQDLLAHRLRILFVAPERLEHPRFQAWIRQQPISLVVVDEAHCLSAWGFDFRPDYRQIPGLLGQLSYPPVLALTATALPSVRDDIVQALGIHTVVQAPLDRPNLGLSIHTAPGSAAQTQHLHQILDTLAPTDRVLCYADSRRDTERWAQHLRQTRGVQAVAYHAGLDPAVRQAAQTTFTEGSTPILIATTAFGMGVDIPAIRAVIHLGIPASPADYYQQIGRAGRDGERAVAYLTALWGPANRLRRHLIEINRPDEAMLGRLWDLAQARGMGSPSSGALWPWPDDPDAHHAIRLLTPYLTEYGLAEWVPGGPRETPWLKMTQKPTDDDRERMLERFRHRYHVQESHWADMQRFVQDRSCHRAALHAYFGAEPPQPTTPCCDVCHPDAFIPVPTTTGPLPSIPRPVTSRRPLLVVLTEWRTATAAIRTWPPYAVLSDEALHTLAAHPPRTRDELAALGVLTPEQWQQWATPLVAITTDYAARPPEPRPPSSASVTRTGRCQILMTDGAPHVYPAQERTIVAPAPSIRGPAPSGRELAPDSGGSSLHLTIAPEGLDFVYDRLQTSPTRWVGIRLQPSAQCVIQWLP